MPKESSRPLAVDTRTDTVGEIMGKQNGQIYLRPLHGGPEWALTPDRVQPISAEEIGRTGE
ncbi:hypothetical protein AB0J21_33000 [Streptomyces sp. NPDC049954]|uniref:hypothetical protein n=1 Tax=Streptomyces sp. NPDC049954 TaxID=3155779 RepID=UPI00341FFF7F